MYYISISKKEKEIILRRGLFLARLEFVIEDRLKFASEKLSVYQNSIERISNLCFVTWSEFDCKVISQFVTMDYSKSSRTINFNVTLVEVLWSDFLFRGLNQIKNSECWKLFLKRWHIESFYEFTNKKISQPSEDDWLVQHGLLFFTRVRICCVNKSPLIYVKHNS